MNITVNGENKAFENITKLSELIDQICPNNKRVIAELNGTIVKSDDWNSHTINDGDTIELVSFVGGG